MDSGGGGSGSIEMTSLSNASNSSSSNSSSSNQVTNINKMPTIIELLEKNTISTAIVEAIKSGAGADADTPDGKGYTPLFWAASKGLTDVVVALIARHVNLNAQTTGSGNTALMVACMNGNIRIAELLINGGANVVIKNKSGSTARSSLLTKMLTLPDTSEMAKEKLTPEQRPAFYVTKQLKQQFNNLLEIIERKEREQRGAGRRRHRNKSHKSRRRRAKKSKKSKKSKLSTSRKVKRQQ